MAVQAGLCGTLSETQVFSFLIRRLKHFSGTIGMDTPDPSDLPKEIGSLYSFELDGSIRKHKDNVSLSNGLAWTADNKTMYYTDSIPRKVMAYDFDLATGTMSKFHYTFLRMSYTGTAPAHTRLHLRPSSQVYLALEAKQGTRGIVNEAKLHKHVGAVCCHNSY